ncbi:MAG: septum formation protein Maf [Firmicutes bacterium]|nr:septum formation protein Maf [Bacillota bacterium]
MRQFILASGSPRRIEMMQSHGYSPLVMPSDIEETLPYYDGMTETVTFLALKKARDVEARWLNQTQQNLLSQAFQISRVSGPSGTSGTSGTSGGSQHPPIIIAADTIVYYDGEIMGKPLDKEDGFRMLSALRGQVHYVVTGVALVEAGAQNTRVFYEITRVYFTDYSDEELQAYLETDEAYDKAGGYAIQGYFSRYVDHIEGDYDNVVGFPWKRIMKELIKFK